MKKGLLTMAGVLLTVSLVSAGTTVPVLAEEETTLVYGSGDYTRINPAMDEHGEINILIFNGLTAHDGDNQVVPGLAESWDFDDETNTYTFHMAEDAKWQDGEPVTAEDVKFTIEAIMDPENGSENAPNYEDVEEINVIDDHTVAFKLEDKNVAFLDYMTMAVLPKHLLEGEDMQTSDFFRNPVGTGPYKIESWDEGQAITLVKNEDYFKGEPSIDKVVFKIVPDDNAKALQLKSGELDLALLTPKDAAAFADDEAYTCYDMKTSDYRGIMFNFGNEYWQKNRDLIPAVCYGLDRQAIIDAVLLGQGMPAYGPLQRNIYNYEDVEHYDYNPEKAKEILEAAGCEMGDDGFYYRDGEKVGFVISVSAGDQVRIDMAQIAAQELKEIGMDVQINCTSDNNTIRKDPTLWDVYASAMVTAPTGDPEYFFTSCTLDESASNNGHYHSDKLEDLEKQMKQEFDADKRSDLAIQMQQTILDDNAYVFCSHLKMSMIMQSNVTGLVAHPCDYYELTADLDIN